jgi:hypothetical protein
MSIKVRLAGLTVGSEPKMILLRKYNFSAEGHSKENKLKGSEPDIRISNVFAFGSVTLSTRQLGNRVRGKDTLLRLGGNAPESLNSTTESSNVISVKFFTSAAATPLCFPNTHCLHTRVTRDEVLKDAKMSTKNVLQLIMSVFNLVGTLSSFNDFSCCLVWDPFKE